MLFTQLGILNYVLSVPCMQFKMRASWYLLLVILYLGVFKGGLCKFGVEEYSGEVTQQN